jgi:GTPase-associated protein 1, N-terminal domain type 2/GTPase-associated protein 1, middle domain
VALQQLFYTCTRHGLAGRPGYQFNAVTTGVTDDVMRDVERLTAYQPPPGLSGEPSEAEIDACPVSLCHQPGDVSLLAAVQFLGRDLSGRYTNYFAHALATETLEADLGGLLPIETWESPLWTRAESDTTELPPLTEPPPRGSIDRDAVREFLEAEAGRLPMAALLTAAAGAVAGGPAVVLNGGTAAANARWIAAVSYLLPEDLVWRMSFTTYQRRPRDCALHVVGTVPDPDATQVAVRGFHLFDVEVPGAVDVEPHPLAELLARTGPVAAEGLWREAAALAEEPPRTLDDWHPLVAAALASRAGDEPGPEPEPEPEQDTEPEQDPEQQPEPEPAQQPDRDETDLSPAELARAQDLLGAPPRRGDREQRDEYLRWCRLLATHAVRPLLNARSERAVAAVEPVERDLAAAAEPDARKGVVIRRLINQFARAPDPVVDLLIERLPPLITPLGVDELATILPDCPREVMDAWIEHARPALEGPGPDVDLAARLFVVRGVLIDRAEPCRWTVEELLITTVPSWQRRDWEALLSRLEARRDLDLATEFLAWREQHDQTLGTRMGRLVARLPWSGRHRR